MENDTNVHNGAESATRLILEVAEAFVDADERDRCLAVMMMSTEVTGIENAVVSTGAADALHPVVATSDRVLALESFPGALLRRSVVDCLASGSVVAVPVHPSDVPFDGHAERMLHMGLHHEYLLPLVSRNGVHGVISLYDGDELGRGRSGLGLAAALVSVAGTLLHLSRVAEMSNGLVGHLQTALNARITIEQAKGVLAERNGSGMDASFRELRQQARNERRSVADVAAAIVRSL